MIMKNSIVQKGVKDEGVRNEDESMEEDGLPMVVFFL